MTAKRARRTSHEKPMTGLSLLGAVVGQGVLSGAVIGFLTGMLEVLILLATTRTATNFLVPAVVFYAVTWSVLAVILGLIRWGLRSFVRRPLRVGEPVWRWNLAVLIPLALFIVVGGHVNMYWLPAFTDWRSLLFDAAFLLLNIGLGLWLYRHALVWAATFLQRFRKLWVPLAVGVLALGVLTGTLSLWGRRHEPSAVVPGGHAGGPNVLLIVIDATRPDHLSTYGYARKTSPNLDHLAREGTLFTNAYANASWTKASVATLLTSLYPSSHGSNLMASGVSASALTLPEVLQSQGYATGIFSANAFLSPVFGHGQGVGYFYYKDVSVFNELILGHIVRGLRKFSPLINRAYEALKDVTFGPHRLTTAPGLTDAFLSWMEQLQGRPFFAYLHYIEPHAPYSPPAPFDTQFDPAYQGPKEHDAPLAEGLHPFRAASGPLPEPRLRNLIAQYDGEIAFVDHVIGRLIERLRALGAYDNTVILVTADHGEELYDHGGWGHGKSLYQEVLQVPLIVRYPPVVPQGQVVTAIARHVDLMPTILDFCQVSASSTMEGRSLVPVMRRDASALAGAVAIYSEVSHAGSYARAVQEGRFKLIEAHAYNQEAWLLFDLAQDPQEQRPLDVATSPKGEALKRLLVSFHERAKERAVTSNTVQMDQTTREELRTLGYLQ